MFINRKKWLGRHTALLRSPDDLQGFGSFSNGDSSGGGGGGQQPGAGQQGSGGAGDFEMPGQQTPLIGVNDGNTQPDDLDEIINAFAEPDDLDDDPDPNQQQAPQIPQDQVDAMRQQVQTAISQMRVTDDMIPQDFDPNDRQQMTNLVNRVMQQTIANSMNVVFQPVQLAMKQMAMTLQNQIETRVNQTQTGMKDSAVFESIVPEAADPKYSGLVKQLDSTLKATGNNKVRERAQLVRKMLNQMGIKSNGAGDRRTSNPGGGNGPVTKREGHAALDAFFGSWQPPGQQQRR